MNKSHEIVFDLETIPNAERIGELEEIGILEPLPEKVTRQDSNKLPEVEEFLSHTIPEIEEALFGAPPVSSYLIEIKTFEEKSKKPRKGVLSAIDKVEKLADRYEIAVRDRSRLMATCPELCRICAVGFARDDNEPKGFVADTPELEAEIIEILWGEFRNARPIIGFNIINFDLPVLFARSIFLGIAPTRELSNVKPWDGAVIDIYLKRFGNRGNTDKKRPGTCKKLAQVYGIEVPAGDFDGSQVEEAMRTAKGQKKIREYVKSDVLIERELYRKFSGFYL